MPGKSSWKWNAASVSSRWIGKFEKLGCDIESRVQGTGQLRFIEVKGRISGAPTITVTCNEILYSLNKSEDYILGIVGIVEFLDNGGAEVQT